MNDSFDHFFETVYLPKKQFHFDQEVLNCMESMSLSREMCKKEIRDKKEKYFIKAHSFIHDAMTVPLYRTMIIQDINQFYDELKKFGQSTPHKEATKWDDESYGTYQSPLEHIRMGVGSSWSLDEKTFQGYGGYVDGGRDAEIKLECYVDDPNAIDKEDTLLRNVDNDCTEKEIVLKKGTRLQCNRMILNFTHSVIV